MILFVSRNLTLTCSFRNSGFSALRSDRTHSRSCIFSTGVTQASGGIIIFIRQGLSLSELSTSSLSLLDPYSGYVGVNISLNDSSSLSFFNGYALPIRFCPTERRTNSFFPPSFPPPGIFLFWGTSIAITHSGTQKVLPTLVGRKYSIGTSPLTSSPSMILTYLLFSICSSGSRSSPDTSFSPSSLAISGSWEVPQDLGSDHQPILQTVSLSPVFCSKERLPSFNFQKAGWDDFAFYFDSHCSSAKEYLSLSLFSADVLFTSLTLNALLTIWCSRQTALFLSLLAKAALAYLQTALPVALRPPFSFQQAQYAQVAPLKPAPSCKLFAGLCSTNMPATSLLLSDFRFVLSSIFLFTSTSLIDLAETVFCLLLFYQAAMDPRTLFSPGKRRGRCASQTGSVTPALSNPLWSFFSYLSYPLFFFSRIGGVLSYRSFLTHRFPRFPPRNLCILITLAAFSLVYAATHTAYC